MYCDCYHSREMHHQTCVAGMETMPWPWVFCTLPPTRPPFVRRRHKPSHLWSKSRKRSNESSSDKRPIPPASKNRTGRKRSSSRPPTAASAALRQRFHAHWDGGARADINIYILGSGAADFSRILGRWSLFRLPLCLLSLPPSLSLFPSVSRLFL